jgi:putative MATE family efflux protein
VGLYRSRRILAEKNGGERISSLTEGNPVKGLVLFTLPFMAGEICQLLYSAADTFIVGRTLGVNALAAVGCTGVLVSFVFGFAIGLTNGFAVILAQRFGARDDEGVRRSSAISLELCVIFAALVLAVFVPLLMPLLRLMRTPAEIIEDAHRYISIIFYGVGITFLNNMLTNILRSVGDSKTPFYFLIFSSVLNIALDYLFILGFSWGVSGAAIATVIAQLFSLILCAVHIVRRFPQVFPRERTGWFVWRWDMPLKEAATHLSMGVIMGAQRSIVEVGNLLVQSGMNGLGALSIAAITAAQRVRHFNMLPLFSISYAVTTFTAQNYGAQKIKRVYQGILGICSISVAISVAMGVINFFFGANLAGLFLGDNPEALSLAHLYLKYIGASLFLLGIMLNFRSVMQGLGRKRSPTLCSVLETVMSVLTAFVLIPRLGFIGVCLANPLSWLASGIPLYIAFALFARKKVHVTHDYKK